MSAKTGRPKKKNPINIRVSVRLDAETDRRLIDYCGRNEMTKGEAIRKGIVYLLDNERFEKRTVTVKTEPQEDPKPLVFKVRTVPQEDPKPLVLRVECPKDDSSDE